MTVAAPGDLVVDTHAAVWYLQRDEKLSRRARAAIADALAEGRLIHREDVPDMPDSSSPPQRLRSRSHWSHETAKSEPPASGPSGSCSS